MPPLAILHQNVTQELNQGLFSGCLGKKQWLAAGQLTWAVGGPAAAYAFLQAAAPASRGRSTVLCQLRITGPLVGHRGGKQAKVGLSEMLRTPAAGNPLLPCPAQPTRRVGLKGSTEKCCFWFTDVITPTVCRPRLISLDTCWQEAVGRLPGWNGSVTEPRPGRSAFWHSSPLLFMQGFLKDGLFGLLLTGQSPPAFSHSLHSHTWFELVSLLWVELASQVWPGQGVMDSKPSHPSFDHLSSIRSLLCPASTASTASPFISKMPQIKRRQIFPSPLHSLPLWPTCSVVSFSTLRPVSCCIVGLVWSSGLPIKPLELSPLLYLSV